VRVAECRECGGTFSGYELCHECDTSDARIAALERQLAEKSREITRLQIEGMSQRRQLAAALDRLREVGKVLDPATVILPPGSTIPLGVVEKIVHLETLFGPTLADGLGEAIDAAKSAS
jgi:hypothetical protein